MFKPRTSHRPLPGTSKSTSSSTSYQLIKKAECFSQEPEGEIFKVVEKPPSILNLTRADFETRIQKALASSLTGTETVQLKFTTLFFTSSATCLYQLYSTQALDEKVMSALQLATNEQLVIRPGVQGISPINAIGETYVDIVGGVVKSVRHHNYGFAVGSK